MMKKKIFDLDVEPIEALDVDAILKEKEETKERIRQAEQGKLDKMKCPVCGSTNKEHVVKTNNNGVFGPGYHSWVTEDYFVCKDCGVMYKQVKK